MTVESQDPTITGPNDTNQFIYSENRHEKLLPFRFSEETVYASRSSSPQTVDTLHHDSVACRRSPITAWTDSQATPVTANTDELAERMDSFSEALETHLRQDAAESVRDDLRAWSEARDTEQPFAVAARYGALNLLLKATLYEWYTQRDGLPILKGDVQAAFEKAGAVTGNRAFAESGIDEFVWQAPSDLVTEICRWRYGLLTADDPADTIATVFAELIPSAERQQHGQFRTPRRISVILRELAIQEGDQVLDAGMGAGALSVPGDTACSARIFGVEQDRLGFLMATTALALSGQPGVVHEIDFFDSEASTLGMSPDAAIEMGADTGGVDIVPDEVDAAISNPPYVANRNLERDGQHYRGHLAGFGDPDQEPYRDGEKKLSGRSDLFVYFVTRATQFLKDKGRLVYLLPTKWMETGYGQTLQRFLLDHYRLSAVIAFEDDIFDDVDVNAVILVAERCASQSARRNTTTRFITISGELAPAKIADLVSGEAANDADTCDSRRDRHPGYRVVSVNQSVLENRDATDAPITQYFRTPEALQPLKRNEDLVPLESLAEVSYGTKTGNNEWFLLDDEALESWPLAERFLRPALADVGGATPYRLTERQSDTYILDLHSYIESLNDRTACPDLSEARVESVQRALAQEGYDSVLAYLEAWEATRTDQSSGDSLWFDVGAPHAPDIIHPYRIYRVARVSENVEDLIPTNCANGIDVDPGIDRTVLLGYLNSTVHAAFLELWGQSEGGGSLEVTTRTLSQLPVADVRVFEETDRDAIETAYQALVQGEDRAQTKLDTAVLDALDAELDAATLQEMHESLVQNRLSND